MATFTRMDTDLGGFVPGPDGLRVRLDLAGWA